MVQAKILFGQYLIEQNKITMKDLKKALKIQKSVNKKIGRIFLDMKIFSGVDELQRYLNNFEEYKETMELIYIQARAFGNIQQAERL